MSEQELWQDSDRDIWRYDTHRGKRVTVRANAEYLNSLEAELDVLRRNPSRNFEGAADLAAELLALRTRLETVEKKAALAEELAKSFRVPVAWSITVDAPMDIQFYAPPDGFAGWLKRWDALSAPESTEASE